MKCFWDLSTERLYQQGYIPVSRIREHGFHVGLDRDIIDAFVTIIRTMDEGYLGWVVDQAEKQRDQNKPGVSKPTVVPGR